ncbi:MAG: hypothetical protein J3K34DRAFT_232545 [Monoraphidium minutum]|nr:MAG: hypothetical protein J3K34DRAFT_232545 [Monoraphidium minutum]
MAAAVLAHEVVEQRLVAPAPSRPLVHAAPVEALPAPPQTLLRPAAARAPAAHAPPPADAPLHRRLLRFVVGALSRRTGPRDEHHSRHHAQQQQHHQLSLTAEGAATGGAEGGGALPLSPADEISLFEHSLEHHHHHAKEGHHHHHHHDQQQQQQEQQQQQQQHAPGALRRALAWALRHARATARHFRPQGCGPNDALMAERIFNIITSVPFVLIGANILKSGGTAPRRRFGASFIGCGVVAAAYHSCPPGRTRRMLRKLDYWSICWTSSVLRGAAGLHAPPALDALAALLTPVKPLLVTGANLVAVEARYLTSALRHVHLRRPFGAHVSAAAAGVACFLLDDLLVLERGAPPVFHSMWHVLSSAALGLIGPLLAHCEAALLLEGVQVMVAA